MRILIRALLTALGISLFFPLLAAAGHDSGARSMPRHRPAPVSIKVSAGFSGQFRDTAWTPIRVTLHNRTATQIDGVVEVPDTHSGSPGPSQPFHSLYQADVSLPAGTTKQLRLYVPGYDISGEVDVTFRGTGGVVASASDFVSTFYHSNASVGAVSANVADAKWLNQVQPQYATINFIHLDPMDLDPLPEALSTFDVIALTNVDSTRLDHAQITALRQFVRNGGTLLLVGGPDWQETLRPLPADLIPGHLAGTQTLPDLHGLQAISSPAPPRRGGAVVVSVLSHPQGSVLASQGNVPLVVRSSIGQGAVEYLAFDPARSPFPEWPNAISLLSHVVSQAAPLAISRGGMPQGFLPQSPFMQQNGPPADIGSELANVSSAALPSLILFVILTALYILLLGPVNFLVLRRFRRRELAWVTVPVLALGCVALTFMVAFRLKGNTVLLNTVTVVTLAGDDPHPATMYVGLFAPVRGDYHLTYGGSALPASVPQFDGSYGSNLIARNNPVGMTFQEGRQTDLNFLSMNMWSMRAASLRTSVGVPGRIESDLHPDMQGYLVGTVHNGTSLNLVHPLILAGRSISHLPDIGAGETIHVRLKPSGNIYADQQTPIAFQLYGQPPDGWGNWGNYYSRSLFSSAVSVVAFGCCPGASPPEKNMTDRIRNTAAMLPDMPAVTSLGEVVFLGWSEKGLGSLTVDGATPERRDLTLVSAPLQVHLQNGPFQLRTGTVGARLVDDVPQMVQNGCCWNGWGQPVFIGASGSATFQFDLPGGGHARMNRLTLWVDGGGATGDDIGRVFNWRSRRWERIDLSAGNVALSHPARFVSPQGSVLLRLNATSKSGDVKINNPYQDLQISGEGVMQ